MALLRVCRLLYVYINFPALGSRVSLTSSHTPIDSFFFAPSFPPSLLPLPLSPLPPSLSLPPPSLLPSLGDIVTVIAKEDDVWWCGQSKGKTGMFPSAYVEPYDGQVDFV